MILRTSTLNCKNLCRNIRRFSTSKSEYDYPQRIFSGIQPTGTLHLGNYLGAVVNWLQFQDRNEDLILMIADLHSMTVSHIDPNALSKDIFGMVTALYGCGLDPEKILLFQQSSVTCHYELNWFLSCIATMGRLNRLPQYREKSENLSHIPLGLFIYPVLQAADILAYKSTLVPVGEDQLHHIRLAKELAEKFNEIFGRTFPKPEPYYATERADRIKSLRDPTRKMSKSDPTPRASLLITDPPDVISYKIKKAVTDSVSRVTFDPVNRPGVSNLISIHAALSKLTVKEICQQAEGTDTGQYKYVVADAIIKHLEPIQERINLYRNDRNYVLNRLEMASKRATELAIPTIEEVKEKLGLMLNIEEKSNIKSGIL